jgi:hypothetical protein
MDEQPSEAKHIFLHQEGNDWIAYHSGTEISRKTRVSQERFYADLHVWIRKHRYEGPIWRVATDGKIERDQETEERAARAYENSSSI